MLTYGDVGCGGGLVGDILGFFAGGGSEAPPGVFGDGEGACMGEKDRCWAACWLVGAMADCGGCAMFSGIATDGVYRVCCIKMSRMDAFSY